MNVFRHFAERAEGAIERAARLRSRGVRGRRLPQRLVRTRALLGLTVAVVWLGLWLTIGSDSAEIEGNRPAVDGLRKIGRQIGAREDLELPIDTRGSEPAAAELLRTLPEDLWLEPVAASAASRRDPLPALFRPSATAAALAWSGSDWLAEVSIDGIEILGIYQTSFGAVARARCARRDGVLALRTGDRLNDGEVAWIGFFSPRLAAVRLKQRPWPAHCDWRMPAGSTGWKRPTGTPSGRCDGKPYREIFRVLGWDSILDRGAPQPGEVEPVVPQRPLRVVGREGLGSWPDENYSSARQILAETVDGERLPRVDLFAAVVYEMYGLLPWQHPSWSRRGWTVEQGLPLLGSIKDLAEAPVEDSGLRRDHFRSLLEPWTSRSFLGPTRRPGGLAGLPIEDVELEEIYMTAGGPVAEIKAAGSFRPLVLRPGDRLWDSEVIRVDATRVIFKQTVNDALALKPFRQVVRTLDHGDALGIGQ